MAEVVVAVGSYAFSLVPPVACGVLASYLLDDPTLLYVLIGVDFALQLIGWAHSAYNASEKYYDATGALTYITLTLTSLLLPSVIALIPQTDKTSSAAVLRPLSDLTYRQIVASAAVMTWAARLGRHLYQRILQSGRDSRFDGLRSSPAKLAVAWSMQGLWVFVVGSAVFTMNAQPTSRAAEGLNVFDVAGVGLWLVGFALEVVADMQKSEFAANKRHYSTPFISSGLWYYSRHPNYAGEILLWIGLFVFSLSVRSGPYQLLTALSPVLDGALICFISGIPLLEAANDHKFGEDRAYRQYKANTPILIPNLLKA